MTATGRNFASLYGAYGDKILGAVNTSGSWKVAEYPGDAEYTMPEACR